MSTPLKTSTNRAESMHGGQMPQKRPQKPKNRLFRPIQGVWGYGSNRGQSGQKWSTWVKMGRKIDFSKSTQNCVPMAESQFVGLWGAKTAHFTHPGPLMRRQHTTILSNAGCPEGKNQPKTGQKRPQMTKNQFLKKVWMSTPLKTSKNRAESIPGGQMSQKRPQKPKNRIVRPNQGVWGYGSK